MKFSETMKISEMLIKHEGLRLFVYNDSLGIPTIGVGRNLKDRGITREEAMMMLENDIEDFTKQLSESLFWFDTQPEKVKMVLIDMAFNMGVGGLLTFHNTLEHIKNGDYVEASRDMLNSRWAVQVGVRALELADIIKNIKKYKNILT
jgi:lysozyme